MSLETFCKAIVVVNTVCMQMIAFCLIYVVHSIPVFLEPGFNVRSHLVTCNVMLPFPVDPFILLLGDC